MANRKFEASNEFVRWAESIGGMLTKITTKYGSISAMVEHSDWDEGKTCYALSLLQSLRREISKIDKELASHVAEKFGED
jgi:hypothetical protein